MYRTTEENVIDFLNLIWQERLNIIVMVTKLKEGSKTKCEQYWPELHIEQTTFGAFIVTLVDKQVLPDFVIRSMNVKVKMILREY